MFRPRVLPEHSTRLARANRAAQLKVHPICNHGNRLRQHGLGDIHGSTARLEAYGWGKRGNGFQALQARAIGVRLRVAAAELCRPVALYSGEQTVAARLDSQRDAVGQ